MKVYILIDRDDRWYRCWPEFTPALISAPILAEEPFSDVVALLRLNPNLRQPRPPGDEYKIAVALVCDDCAGSGEVVEIDDTVSWEVDEQGKPYQEPPRAITTPCRHCDGDGLYKVTWTSLPAALLFPSNKILE